MSASKLYARFTLIASYFYAATWNYTEAQDAPHQQMLAAAAADSSNYAVAQAMDYAAIQSLPTDPVEADDARKFYNTYYPAFRDNGETWATLEATLELLHRDEPPMRVIDCETARVAAEREDRYTPQNFYDDLKAGAFSSPAPASNVITQEDYNNPPQPRVQNTSYAMRHAITEDAQRTRRRDQYNQRDLPREFEPLGYHFYDIENAEIAAYFFAREYVDRDLYTRDNRYHAEDINNTWDNAHQENADRDYNRKIGNPDDSPVPVSISFKR